MLPSRDFVKGSHGYDQHKLDHHEEQHERVASGLQKSAEESMGRAQIASQKGEFITSGQENLFLIISTDFISGVEKGCYICRLKASYWLPEFALIVCCDRV